MVWGIPKTMLAGEFGGRSACEFGVRPDRVVVEPPGVEDHPCLAQGMLTTSSASAKNRRPSCGGDVAKAPLQGTLMVSIKQKSPPEAVGRKDQDRLPVFLWALLWHASE
jgi:hypothetical protein